MTLKAQFQEAKQAVVNALKPEEHTSTDVDILDTLKKEHDEVKKLLSDLQAAESPAERQGLVRQITAALVPHSVAEEKVVYEAMISLSDSQAQVDGYEGTLEHKWAAKTLGRLGAIDDATSSEHKATAKVLRELVEHHIKEEERNIWARVKDNFSDEQRAAMNREFLAAKKKVKVA